MTLAGSSAVITGGSRGLGEAIAARFLQAGADVLLCARTASELFATRERLSAAFPHRLVLAAVCDVSEPAQVAELAAMAESDLRAPLGALVLNAAVLGPAGPSATVDLELWRRAVEINLMGVFLPVRAFLPRFRRAGRGKIVVLSGGGATRPMPNFSAYAASKAAVVRLAETLAEEFRPLHIDVNAIAPGALATRMLDQVLAAGPENVGEAYFRQNLQWKETGAVPLALGAGLAVFLASSASDGITGKLISAQWDPWRTLDAVRADLEGDIYTLRRIVPADRGKTWGEP